MSYIILLPFPMILKHHSARFALLTANYSVSAPSAPSVLRKTYTKPASRPFVYASSPIPFDSNLSTLSSLSVKSFKTRTSSKRACNPFRMRSFKTQDLNPFGMCSYKKNGSGGRSPRFPKKPPANTHEHPQPVSVHALTHDSLDTPGGGPLASPAASPRTLRLRERRLPRPGRGASALSFLFLFPTTHHTLFPTHYSNLLPHPPVSAIFSPEEGER